MFSTLISTISARGYFFLVKYKRHLSLIDNNDLVKHAFFQKLSGVYLDDKLHFCEHIQNIKKDKKQSVYHLNYQITH